MTLVTQLFLSLQSRPDADMTEFFRFENQWEPPSISNQRRLRSGTKSDILECIKVAVLRDATVVVLDCAEHSMTTLTPILLGL